MSDSGDDMNIGSDPFAAYSYSDPSEFDTSGGIDTVTVTPQVTLPGDTSSPSANSSFDISNLISTIDKTFVSTYNALNPQGAGAPPATSSYGATQATGAPTSSSASSLFKPPMLYYLMGGAGVLLLLMTKKGDS